MYLFGGISRLDHSVADLGFFLGGGKKTQNSMCYFMLGFNANWNGVEWPEILFRQ